MRFDRRRPEVAVYPIVVQRVTVNQELFRKIQKKTTIAKVCCNTFIIHNFSSSSSSKCTSPPPQMIFKWKIEQKQRKLTLSFVWTCHKHSHIYKWYGCVLFGSNLFPTLRNSLVNNPENIPQCIYWIWNLST